MPDLTVEQATEAIYQSLANENANINDHIRALKTALAAAGQKEAVFEPTRLAQNNRPGRKTMQTYFRKRGVTVVFADQADKAADGDDAAAA